MNRLIFKAILVMLVVLLLQYMRIGRLKELNALYLETGYTFACLIRGIEDLNRWDFQFIRRVEK